MPSPCHVLVVDDDDGIREALAMALSDEGRRVSCACNGEEALARLRSGDPLPCLILLDLMMPVMNGQDFRAAQLKDENLSGIPVVLMTAGNVPPEIASLRTLRKPLHLDTLYRLLEGCASSHDAVPG
jgi:CheY-like chemotaxis protein